MMLRPSCLLAVLAVAGTPAFAMPVYKCVSEGGKVTYSQNPCYGENWHRLGEPRAQRRPAADSAAPAGKDAPRKDATDRGAGSKATASANGAAATAAAAPAASAAPATASAPATSAPATAATSAAAAAPATTTRP